VIGLKLLEHDLIKRILGNGLGLGELSRIVWIVGTAVYQVHLVLEKSFQKRDAPNLSGMTIEPVERKGARRPARRPCT